MPLHFSDEELALLTSLAAPTERHLRTEFLTAVAAELGGARGATALFWPAAITQREQGGARLEGEVQNWNTRARPQFITRRASWPFRMGQRWGHNFPHESIDGRGRDAVGASRPGHLCSKRHDIRSNSPRAVGAASPFVRTGVLMVAAG